MTRTDLAKLSDVAGGAITGSHIAAASAQTTMTTSEADITGATLDITNAVDEIWLVDVMVHINWSGSSAGNVSVVSLNLDTSNQAGQCVLHGATVNQSTVAGVWRLEVSAGAHTIKLRGVKTGAGGTNTVEANNTRLRVVRLAA
jgi:copper(I)-binding protein